MKMLIVMLLVASGCYSTEDNLGFSVVGEPRWALGFGGRGNDRAGYVAFDSIGDVVVAGYLWESTDQSIGLITTSSFITKRVASDGAERWRIKLQGLTRESSIWIGAMDVTHNDEIVVAGAYGGTVDVGGQTLSLSEPSPPSHGDTFIAKYRPDGTLLWAHGVGENSNLQPDALVIGSDDTVYVAGHFSHGTFVLDGHEYREDVGDFDMVLLAYNVDGSLRWFHVLPGGGNAMPRSMAIASNGDLLIAGIFTAPTSFGGAVINPNARVRSFFARYRSDGLYLESRAVGPVSPWTSAEPQLAVDGAGHIVLQEFESDDSRSYDTDSAHSTMQAFADDGTALWSKRMVNRGSSLPLLGRLLATPNGLISSSSWADGPYNSEDRGSVTGEMDVVAFDATGAVSVAQLGSRTWAAPTDTVLWDSAASRGGEMAFTGQFAGKIDFGMGPIATHGQDDADVFIVVVNPPPTDCDASL